MSVITRVLTVVASVMLLSFVAVPAHAQSTPVQVVNAKDAIQVNFGVSLSVGQGFGFSNTFMVPTGKRLVIEYVSGFARMAELQQPAEVAFTTTLNGIVGAYSLLLSQQSSGGQTFHTFVGNQKVQVYADPETLVQFSFLRSSSTDAALFLATVSGYLVDFP